MSPRVAVGILGLVAVPMGCGEARAGDEATSSIRLVWLDPTDVAAGSELAARAEAASLLTGMGATVSWRRGASGEIRPAGEIWVVLLGQGPRPASGGPVLGAIRPSPGRSPIVWVRVPNVRAAAGVSPSGSPLGLEPAARRAFAVALGRVIAHEVVHALLPSLPHGKGLMSERLTRRQLTAVSISVEPAVALAVTAALRHDPSFPPADTGSVVAMTSDEEEEDRGPR